MGPAAWEHRPDAPRPLSTQPRSYPSTGTHDVATEAQTPQLTPTEGASYSYSLSSGQQSSYKMKPDPPIPQIKLAPKVIMQQGPKENFRPSVSCAPPRRLFSQALQQPGFPWPEPQGQEEGRAVERGTGRSSRARSTARQGCWSLLATCSPLRRNQRFRFTGAAFRAPHKEPAPLLPAALDPAHPPIRLQDHLKCSPQEVLRDAPGQPAAPSSTFPQPVCCCLYFFYTFHVLFVFHLVLNFLGRSPF